MLRKRATTQAVCLYFCHYGAKHQDKESRLTAKLMPFSAAMALANGVAKILPPGAATGAATGAAAGAPTGDGLGAAGGGGGGAAAAGAGGAASWAPPISWSSPG